MTKKKWIGLAAILFAIVLAPAAALTQAAKERVHLQPKGESAGVDMSLPGLEGTIGLTLPELINDANRRLIYTDTNLKRVNWRLASNGSLTGTWIQQGLGSYEITAKPEEDGVLLTWKIANLSPEVWSDAAGNVCMRSRAVPALFDPSGERVFLRGGGRWVSVRETGTVGSIWYLPPGKEILPLMKPHLADRSYRIGSFRPDEAIIAVRSRDGRSVLAQAWHESRYVLANVHRHYVCTEAPPFFGTIAPGERITATGKIYFFEGTLDDLAAKYREDLRRKKIALLRSK